MRQRCCISSPRNITVAAAHQLVAPGFIRSQALTLQLAAVQRGDITNYVALQLVNRCPAWGILALRYEASSYAA